MKNRTSGTSRLRKVGLLAALYAVYYLLAATAIFLTVRHIQAVELPGPPTAILKTAREWAIPLRVEKTESYGRRNG